MDNENNSTLNNEQSLRSLSVQKAIHSFISANIMHRRVIEQWANDAGVHRSQHRMLMYLTKCPNMPSQKALADHFDISPAAVTQTVKNPPVM